ncbi:NAD-dependent epimerase/dehydratase family protein [Pseudochryseolinea flava]|uniref:Epimerase n=1 Tax=Pseudochryseolinea flava TaxID=2059302 RepID=A0A364Y453_9BACT|nr:NAD-dependent epimerase/dehydratase family protein [Pseudochryseolinea flava]RAW00968.1 epimerase [Pseudochryseolinea flava]
MNVIITGATGMVGEGALLECLQNPVVKKVLIINRRPYGTTHPKLQEVIHENFYDFLPIEHLLSGYDACFFCLGVTSIGLNEQQYTKPTHTLTLHVAETLCRLNPQMTFIYVSGAGTDSTEKGRTMWARVKGKTENDLMKLPFKAVFAFRPGFMKSTPGAKNTLSFYKYVEWLFPIGRALWPGGFCKLSEVAQAMINVTQHGFDKNVLEVKDIVRAAHKR